MDDPDPERLIYDNVRPLPVPIWEPKSHNSRCRHCDERLGLATGAHNCRLCGFMFCRLCSAKYHIPDEYKLKEKPGAVRVCLGCRDKCLKSDDASQGQSGHVTIYPPAIWLDVHSQVDCAKCRRRWKGKRDKRHNCRVCGQVFCGQCSSKLTVPPAYCRKDKKGPRRVCDMCRYLIVAGAELSEEPMPAPPPLRRPSEPSSSKVPTNNVLVVRWKYDSSFIAELTNDSGQCTLLDYRKKLMSLRPELGDDDLVFYCRDVVVHPAHFDIFQHEHLLPVLYVDRPAYSQNAFVLDEREISMHAKRASNIVVEKKIKKKPPQKKAQIKGEIATVLYDYDKPGDPTHICVKAGDSVYITHRDNDSWWLAKRYVDNTKVKGWLPASFVRLGEGDDKSE